MKVEVERTVTGWVTVTGAEGLLLLPQETGNNHREDKASRTTVRK